jgi:hypothetical protein
MKIAQSLTRIVKDQNGMIGITAPILLKSRKVNNSAQPAVGTDLAFGQVVRRIVSSMGLVVY